jgi:hypothetical protein
MDLESKRSSRTHPVVAVLLLVAGVALAAAGTASSSAPPDEAPDGVLMPYPEGYRHWTRVKTTTHLPDAPGYERFGGVRHVYANAVALEHLLANRHHEGATPPYPDGAVFVADFFQEKQAGGQIHEGARRMINVMVRDARRYTGTGGWGFQEYRGNGRTAEFTTIAQMQACHACHEPRLKDTGGVFSRWNEG